MRCGTRGPRALCARQRIGAKLSPVLFGVRRESSPTRVFSNPSTTNALVNRHRCRPLLAGLVLVALFSSPVAHADGTLSAAERQWIEAGMPALRYARSSGLPLDIVVQPGSEPDGRCKLVVSMRGNPRADALVAGVPPRLFVPIVEAVFAHEIAHCWRWSRGAWNKLPAGFVDRAIEAPGVDPAHAALARSMLETRREEGYADLVGLAWTRRSHPGDYAGVLAWLERVRQDEFEGEHHDTGAWLRLVRDPAAFGDAPTLFEQAEPLWERGLREALHPQ